MALEASPDLEFCARQGTQTARGEHAPKVLVGLTDFAPCASFCAFWVRESRLVSLRQRQVD
jgi:hypothetical protein